VLLGSVSPGIIDLGLARRALRSGNMVAAPYRLETCESEKTAVLPTGTGFSSTQPSGRPLAPPLLSPGAEDTALMLSWIGPVFWDTKLRIAILTLATFAALC
jgi:hypothetical protein